MAGRDAGMLGAADCSHHPSHKNENMVKSPHIAFHEKRGIQTFSPLLLAYCWQYCWTWDTEILLNNQWERMGLG